MSFNLILKASKIKLVAFKLLDTLPSKIEFHDIDGKIGVIHTVDIFQHFHPEAISEAVDINSVADIVTARLQSEGFSLMPENETRVQDCDFPPSEDLGYIDLPVSFKKMLQGRINHFVALGYLESIWWSSDGLEIDSTLRLRIENVLSAMGLISFHGSRMAYKNEGRKRSDFDPVHAFPIISNVIDIALMQFQVIHVRALIDFWLPAYIGDDTVISICIDRKTGNVTAVR